MRRSFEVNAKPPRSQEKIAKNQEMDRALFPLGLFPRRLGSLAFVFLLSLSAVPAPGALHELKTTEITVTVDDETGDYSVARSSPAQTWSGSASSPLKQFMQGEGSDNVGGYKSVEFKIGDEDAFIHLYKDHPLIVFGWNSDNALSKPPADFPSFTRLPENQHILSYQNSTLSPPRFDGKQSAGSPYMFFDEHASTTILSPAANFMTASLHGDGQTSISSGFNEQLANLPAGFKHQTLMVLDQGINKTMQTFGDGLIALLDVKRPANDADTGLKMLGYWTDNRATYYYRYDKDKGYAGTLLAVADELKKLGVKIGYMQIDSWWYQKTSTGPEGKEGDAKKSKDLPEGSWNKYGGLLEWTAHP